MGIEFGLSWPKKSIAWCVEIQYMQRALEIQGSKEVPGQKQCFRDSQVERSMPSIREGFLKELKCFKNEILAGFPERGFLFRKAGFR